jgi:L-iditol 2-dehydrogenase
VDEGLPMCRDGGRYPVVGHYGNAGTMSLNPHDVTRKQIVIAGSWGFEPRHTYAGLQFLGRSREKFPVERLIPAGFPLDRANEALQATASWSGLKSAITP